MPRNFMDAARNVRLKRVLVLVCQLFLVVFWLGLDAENFHDSFRRDQMTEFKCFFQLYLLVCVDH